MSRKTGIGDYTTKASKLNKNYYLKHDVVDDIITASYVCFVYNNSEHCMKGADGGASFAANTQMIKEFQTFNNLGDYHSNEENQIGCRFDSSMSECYSGGFDRIQAGDNYVGVRGSDSGYCRINSAGYSYCE